jgi:hypothetical protein
MKLDKNPLKHDSIFSKRKPGQALKIFGAINVQRSSYGKTLHVI